MNLIITINNAQMIIEKENLGRNEMELREGNTCVVTVKSNWPAVKKKKNQTLNKKNSSKIPILGEWASERASERFLTGFDTRGQLNHGPVFAQM